MEIAKMNAEIQKEIEVIEARVAMRGSLIAELSERATEALKVNDPAQVALWEAVDALANANMADRKTVIEVLCDAA